MGRFDSHINQAMRHFHAGRLDQSEQICQQVLRVDGRHAAALHTLGLVAHARGDRQTALQCLSRATSLARNEASYHANLGVVQQATGAYDAAESSYRQSLQLCPGDAQTLANLGGTLGCLGRYREAVAVCSQALQLNPNNPHALTNLGSALRKLGHLQESIRALRIAQSLAPEFDMVWLNLGLALWNVEQMDDAVAALRRAWELNPRNPEVNNSLASALQNLGDKEEAATFYQRALELDPQFAEAHKNYGLNLQLRGRLDEAVEQYREAIRLNPGSADAHFNLAGLLVDEGRGDEACHHYEQAARLSPSADYVATAAVFLPALYRSREDILRWRARFAAGVEYLHEAGIRLRPGEDLITTSFYLAYQGLNDVDLQRRVAQLYVPAPEQANARFQGEPPTRRRIRVGFISRYFYDHTIGKLNAGLIARLSRQRFEVSVVALEPRQDPRAQAIRDAADHYIPCSLKLHDAVRTLASTNFDVLFYADVGMDVITRALALYRFAPVQCTTWGHPVTTGMPSMDFFVSSALLEPPGAEQHYSEQVVVLPSLPTYYFRPAPLDTCRPRSTWGLSDDRTLYLCPQALFKFHPDIDPLLAGILRGDPRGELVLISARRNQLGESLLARFRETMPDVVDRVRFVDRMPERDFKHLLAASDVLLDTVHFGGGNTTYEALALGKPIVTLPGPFMRGRATMACYQKMGLADCLAATPQEYVELAVRLGTDRAHRAEVESRIRATSGALYEDITAVRQLEEFLESAVEAAWQDQARQSS